MLDVSSSSLSLSSSSEDDAVPLLLLALRPKSTMRRTSDVSGDTF